MLVKKRVLLIAAAMLGVSLGVSAQSSNDVSTDTLKLNGSNCIDALDTVDQWQKSNHYPMVAKPTGKGAIRDAVQNCLFWNTKVNPQCKKALNRFYSEAERAYRGADACYHWTTKPDKENCAYKMSLEKSWQKDNKAKWLVTCHEIVNSCAPGTNDQKNKIKEYCNISLDPYSSLSRYAENQTRECDGSPLNENANCYYRHQKRYSNAYVNKLKKVIDSESFDSGSFFEDLGFYATNYSACP